MKALPLIISLVLAGGTGTVMAQQQIENPGFEFWEDPGNGLEEPVDWSSIKTSDNPDLNPFAPVVWFKSTDAHSGNYSVRLKNVSAIGGIIATGTLTNGRVHPSLTPDSGYVYTIPTDPQWSTPFTGRPDSIAGWYKYYPLHGDKAKVTAVLHVGACKIPENGTQANWVAKAEFVTPADTVDTWTRFSAFFDYFLPVNPEYILMVLTAGNGTMAVDSSTILYDDLEVVFNVGVKTVEMKDARVFYAGGFIHIEGLPGDWYHDCILNLADINGKTVYTAVLTAASFRPAIKPPAGLYICIIRNRNLTLARKIIIN
jgi:hypothetical protein